MQVLVNGVRSKKCSLVSGVLQGSVLGPVLFLIHISDIAEGLKANTLVYVDDTKVRQRVNKEDDIELMQVELDKLYQWGRNNNMELTWGRSFK